MVVYESKKNWFNPIRFIEKSYKLELEDGLLREAYGSDKKEVRFKSIAFVNCTPNVEKVEGPGTWEPYPVYPEFHLIMPDGTTEIFYGRALAKLSSIVAAVKQIYPNVKVGEFLQKSLVNKRVINR